MGEKEMTWSSKHPMGLVPPLLPLAYKAEAEKYTSSFDYLLLLWRQSPGMFSSAKLSDKEIEDLGKEGFFLKDNSFGAVAFSKWLIEEKKLPSLGQEILKLEHRYFASHTI